MPDAAPRGDSLYAQQFRYSSRVSCCLASDQSQEKLSNDEIPGGSLLPTLDIASFHYSLAFTPHNYF